LGLLSERVLINVLNPQVGVRTTWLIENSVEELRNGSLLMLFRTHDTGFIYSVRNSLSYLAERPLYVNAFQFISPSPLT
jgi:hypothetical protein